MAVTPNLLFLANIETNKVGTMIIIEPDTSKLLRNTSKTIKVLKATLLIINVLFLAKTKRMNLKNIIDNEK